MAVQGFIGIDAGTQGLSVVFTNTALEVLATGEASYDMLPDLAEGCYEQHPSDWESALSEAMKQVHAELAGEKDIEVLAIGISGQMHGEVLMDANGEVLCAARLWCDARNEQEERELTELLGVKMPKRITSARWLWTIRNKPDLAQKVVHITTPGGWLAYRLTGNLSLGIGDAAGMFPIDQATLDYDQNLLAKFNDSVKASVNESVLSLSELLPTVKVAGEDAGSLNELGSAIMQLPQGVPVAPAEGDQPASLAGALIGEAGTVSVSFGTSVCANSVGDRAFAGVDRAVDHFCAPDGKPINMVWLRNGTTYMNTVVKMFGSANDADRGQAFAQVMPQVIESPEDCGGLLALPFMDDEPGLGVSRGGTGMLIGLNDSNNTAGNAVKAAVLSTMFNMKLGCEVLDKQGFPRKELVLSGGLTRTPELGQVLADVFRTPVTLLESAEEGCAWGAAILAAFRHQSDSKETPNWAAFIKQLQTNSPTRFEPISESAVSYEKVFEKYKRLIEAHQAIDDAVN